MQASLSPVFGGLGSVLMLHHVRDLNLTPFSPNYHLSISPSFLDELLTQLKEDYDLVSMNDVVERINNPNASSYSKPFVAITLDDGYINNFEIAAPIFQKHQVPYTVYIAPEMVEGNSTIWWEDVEHAIRLTNQLDISLPSGSLHFDTSNPAQKNQAYKKLMEYLFFAVDEKQQRKIASDIAEKYGFDAKNHLTEQVANWDVITEAAKNPLCTIGAHSMCHFVLAKLDEAELKFEIAQCREVLEEKIGTPIDHFAYPYGFPKAAGEREFEIVKEMGFKSGVTTRHGVIYPEQNSHVTALPRVSVNGHYQSIHYMKTLLSGLPTRLKNRGRALDVA